MISSLFLLSRSRVLLVGSNSRKIRYDYSCLMREESDPDGGAMDGLLRAVPAILIGADKHEKKLSVRQDRYQGGVRSGPASISIGNALRIVAGNTSNFSFYWRRYILN